MISALEKGQDVSALSPNKFAGVNGTTRPNLVPAGSKMLAVVDPNRVGKTTIGPGGATGVGEMRRGKQSNNPKSKKKSTLKKVNFFIHFILSPSLILFTLIHLK